MPGARTSSASPDAVPSDLVNIVAHIHPDLELLLNQIKQEYAGDTPGDDHYERAMAELMKSILFKPVPYSGAWHPIKFPWHVLEAMNHYLAGIEPFISNEAKLKRAYTLAALYTLKPGCGCSTEPISEARPTLAKTRCHRPLVPTASPGGRFRRRGSADLRE